MIQTVLDNVAAKSPLVHCITNYVTVNDVANMILACGGSPIMADDLEEAAEITSLCNALVINIGTLNSRTIAAMLAAGQRANTCGHTVVLDPVGAGASTLRTNTTLSLLKQIKFTVIRGNISEIKTVYEGSGKTKGVDADFSDKVTEENLQENIKLAKLLSQRTGAVIAITGAIDIVANENDAYVIKNGHSQMSQITGTGCMLTGVIAAYCAANEDNILEAMAVAVMSMGYCGEKAFEKMRKMNGGTGSFHIYLLDAMSRLTGEELEGGANIEKF